MLPIKDYIPKILTSLESYSSLVLQAEPGAGKSTIVPLELIKSNLMTGKKVIMLEPRRVAVKSIANYLAKLLGENVGETVGYQIRNERKKSKNTILEIVTDGVLTRRIQNDPELTGVGLIIFDEFHERSIHADLALILALEVQEAYRDDLKLLVMSATIDTDLLSKYLNNSPIIKCPGRTFPVQIEYAGRPSSHLSVYIKGLLDKVLKEQPLGDVLIFLPGQAEINRCMSAAQSYLPQNVETLPLYGGLPLTKQELALNKSSKRRVIFSTNIAETSLTIDGVSIVIDSGLEKVMTFDVKSGLSRLDTSRISKASANQRTGRAGRTQKGLCIRLWGEIEQKGLKDFQTEEISITDLSNLVLELSGWGVPNYDDVNWLTAPPKRHFDVACDLNFKLGLIDNSHKITSLGEKVLSLGVGSRLGAMLLSCDTENEKLTACILAALLSEKDILFNAENSDLTERFVVIYESYIVKNSSEASNINKSVLKLVKSFSNALNVTLASHHTTLPELQSSIGKLLLKAYPDRLAKIRNPNSKEYLLANGRGVTLKANDSLYGSNWLVVCDCDGKNLGGVIYSSVPISFEQINAVLDGEYKFDTYYKLDAKKENIIGRRVHKYMSLVMREDKLNSIPDEQFNSCIKGVLSEEGIKFLNWTTKCESWLAKCQWLHSVVESFPNINEDVLLKNLDTWLIPYTLDVKSLKQLKNKDIYSFLNANLTWEQQQVLDDCAPSNYITPSGKKVLIRYDENQGPTVSVVLQEMFGQLESPMLAMGKVAMRFELLSPAKRPIQTTSDLANFWRSSYFDVAKDMRGKYPKHRWPEKPLEEKPGHSIKKKR